MSRRSAPMAAIVAVLCVSALGGARGGDATLAWSEADEAFVRAHYGCPDDIERGALYPTVIGLLEAARALPAEIMLFDYLEPPAPSRPGGATAGGENPEGAGQTPEKDEKDDQVLVLDTPAVGQERLAYSFYLAGQYDDAARAYRSAYETARDDTHLLALLALSERNAGNLKTARQLFTELQKSEDYAEWAAWMLDTLKGFQEEGEGQ